MPLTSYVLFHMRTNFKNPGFKFIGADIFEVKFEQKQKVWRKDVFFLIWLSS